MADNDVTPESWRILITLWIAQFSCIAVMSINRARTVNISETEPLNIHKEKTGLLLASWALTVFFFF